MPWSPIGIVLLNALAVLLVLLWVERLGDEQEGAEITGGNVAMMEED